MSIYQNMISALAVVLIVLMCMDRQTHASPQNPYCSTSDDCGPNACCLVGFERYSYPRCTPTGDVGAWCRVYSSPRSMTLGYPNGDVIQVPDGYHGFCPCLPGLVCSRKTSRCTDPAEDNSIPVFSF